ncbi:hypothetical protein GCM10022221_60800 [Actinocorallia aurea]
MSRPVAATSATGANSSCSTGSAKTATRAPAVNDHRAPTAASSTRPSRNAGGQRTAKPPANVKIDRPPRNPAKTGQACPAIAAPTARYTGALPEPGHRSVGRSPSTPAAAPSRPAAAPFSRSPANTGAEDRGPSCRFMFQKPGFRSPTRRGSNPCARATSTATGTEPRR